MARSVSPFSTRNVGAAEERKTVGVAAPIAASTPISADSTQRGQRPRGPVERNVTPRAPDDPRELRRLYRVEPRSSRVDELHEPRVDDTADSMPKTAEWP
jgi:hypothetical protein